MRPEFTRTSSASVTRTFPDLGAWQMTFKRDAVCVEPLTLSDEVVHNEAVGRRVVVLEHHAQFVLQDRQQHRELSTVDGPQWRQRLHRVRKHSPRPNGVVWWNGKTDKLYVSSKENSHNTSKRPPNMLEGTYRNQKIKLGRCSHRTPESPHLLAREPESSSSVLGKI